MDEQAIRQTIDRYGELRNAGDVEGIVALFTDDAALMVPGVPTLVGTDALRKAFAPFRDVPGQECAYEFEQITAVGDLATVRSHSSGTVISRDTRESKPAAWRELFTLREVDGAWRIANYMFQATGS